MENLLNKFGGQILNKLSLLVFIILLAQTSLFAQQNNSLTTHKRQFRGVWIASVRNLDWPSEAGMSVRKLKKEYLKYLDNLKDIGMNAVIVQVRPIADSFYPSQYEPWSEYLTGKQGLPPKKSFDPLAFMVKETHKRAMEFHAWFNPYRAALVHNKQNLSSQHIYYQHPEWFLEYGKDIYFDPGIPSARKFVEKVIADVVTRYDIDAVHFDDYYYPYRITGLDFPDTASFAKYNHGYSLLAKDDWRRNNVNLLVHELYDTINLIKPWVHFGISPFGVWRNKSEDPRGSNTQTLQTNYDDLYGDSRKWVENGWLDYILPQCYQYLGRDIMDYREVTSWWNDNSFGVNFYIGQGPFRLGNDSRGEPWTIGNEIVRQLYYNDSIPRLLGSAYFRAKTFSENPLGINDSLKNTFYKYPALPPVSRQDRGRESKVTIEITASTIKRKKVMATWQVNSPQDVRYFVIYKSFDIANPKNIVAVTGNYSFEMKDKSWATSRPRYLIITAVDKYRIESNPILLLEL